MGDFDHCAVDSNFCRLFSFWMYASKIFQVEALYVHDAYDVVATAVLGAKVLENIKFDNAIVGLKILMVTSW